MNKLLASTLVSIGFTTAAATLVMAQTATPPGSGAVTQPSARHQHQARAFKMPSERVEARLEHIKTALKITDAQQPQWNSFADTLRRQATALDKQIETRRAQMPQRAERERLNAIAQLERRAQLHTAMLANLNERLAVQKPLYAALTDEQKQVADRVLAPRHGHRGPNHRGKHRLV